MKIISLVKEVNEFSGFISKKDNYTEFYSEKEKIIYGKSYPKKDYRNYGHFVGVMSKFDPFLFFLEKPISIEKLNRKTLEQLWEKIK